MASSKTMGFKNLALAATSVATVAMGGYILVAQGSVNVQNKINQSSGTGIYLAVGGTDRYREFKGTMVNSGGLTSYTTAYISPPFLGSGALLGWDISCGNQPKGLTGDISFKSTLTSSSGAVLTNGNNVTMGTGSFTASRLAQPVVWKGNEYLTFTTLSTPTGTPNCEFWANAIEKYGD